MNANQHEGPGKAHFARNGGSAGWQPKDQLDKRGCGGQVQLHQRRSETAELQQAGQARAGSGEAIFGQGSSRQPGTDDSAHRTVDGASNHQAQSGAQAQLCLPLSEGRPSSFSRHRCRARGSERSGAAPHSASRTPGVWQARIRTAVTDLGFAHLQPAPEHCVPPAAGARTAHAEPADFPLASDASPIPKASQGICASIPCIRGSTTAKQAFITSMPSTLSRNGRPLAAWRRSASGI